MWQSRKLVTNNIFVDTKVIPIVHMPRFRIHFIIIIVGLITIIYAYRIRHMVNSIEWEWIMRVIVWIIAQHFSICVRVCGVYFGDKGRGTHLGGGELGVHSVDGDLPTLSGERVRGAIHEFENDHPPKLLLYMSHSSPFWLL